MSRTFRKFFGRSPGEYLKNCRIEFASNLLPGKKTLAEIALVGGFAGQRRFTRSFKEFTGTMPAKFRRMHGS